jgi:hypothetical protein
MSPLRDKEPAEDPAVKENAPPCRARPSDASEDTTVALPSTALQAAGARQIFSVPPRLLRYSTLLTRILRISGVPPLPLNRPVKQRFNHAFWQLSREYGRQQ